MKFLTLHVHVCVVQTKTAFLRKLGTAIYMYDTFGIYDIFGVCIPEAEMITIATSYFAVIVLLCFLLADNEEGSERVRAGR